MNAEKPIGPNDLKMNWFCVAFIDLLGQRQEMLRLQTLPNENDEKQKQDFDRWIQKTLKPIKKVDGLLATFLPRDDTEPRRLCVFKCAGNIRTANSASALF